MRRMILTLTVGAMQLVLFAGTAAAQEVSFSDGFDFFDTNRWSEENHWLGRSYLSPSNVDTSEGNLRIKIPARSLNGGEIRSNGLYQCGSYNARMRLPYAPSSITGFFLYKAPDYESEIDVEMYDDSSRRIMFTTYAGGSQTHTETMLLPFDPTTGFHDYRFDYATDSITFYVDGQAMKTWSGGVPTTSMHLMVNTWFPSWLEGRKQKKTVYTYVDSIQYTQQ